jgi:hypothetical protein
MKTARFEALESRRLMSVSLGTNLLSNGNGEADFAANETSPVPGWQTQGIVLARYGDPGMPQTTSPGPVDRGRLFFAGGRADQPAQALKTFASASQEIDVSSLAADIDAGRIRYDLSAFLGGYGAEQDTMALQVWFRRRNAQDAETIVLNSLTADYRSNRTGLFPNFAEGIVRQGTRKITVQLFAARAFGRYIDGYADNISLKLSSTAPSTHGWISGTVFNDVNGNGAHNTNEKGLAGVTVFVDRNKNGRLDKGELRAKSGMDGSYVIANVPKGMARLRQIVPNTFRATTVDRTIQVEGGLTQANVKFGVSQTVLIRGTVFRDDDTNGRRGPLESSAVGYQVFLDRNGNGTWETDEPWAVTDQAGNYSLVTRAGTHTVRILASEYRRQTLPAKGKGYSVKLAQGATSARNDFGLEFLPD